MNALVTRLVQLRSSPWLARLGVVLGVLLLLAALLVILRQRELILTALGDVTSRHAWHLVALAGLIVIHISSSATVFTILTRRYGHVPWWDMQMLIASAALLNYLPLRPGLFGRIAYQKAVYDIDARDSVRIVIESLILTAGTAGWILVCIVGARLTGLPLVVLLIAGPMVLVVGVATSGRRWCLAGLVRAIEVGLWAARYHLAFGILGIPLSFEASLIIGGTSLFANLIPFFSNGLGLREWAVGLLGARLATGAAATLELSMAAELINRAMELVVVGLLGLFATMWLLSRQRAGRSRRT